MSREPGADPDRQGAATAPFLQTGGVTFHAGSDRYNVYDLNGQYYDLAGADCGASNCGQPGHLGTPISFCRPLSLSRRR